MKKYTLTLQNKLILAFLLVALAPLAQLALSVHRNTRKALEESANQALFTVAAQAANSLDQFIQTSLTTVGTEAHLPAIVEYMAMSPEQQFDSMEEMAMVDLLSVLSTKSAYISSYALLDAQGLVVYDTQAENIGRDESAESWFTFFDYEALGIEADVPDITRTLHGVRLRDHDIFVSEIELSEVNQTASIYFSSPVHNRDGAYFGLLRARFDAIILQELLVDKNNQAGEGSFGVLFDEYNIHLAHGIEPDVSLVPIVELPSDVTDELIAGRRLPDLPKEQLFTMQLDELQDHLVSGDRFFEAADVVTGNSVTQAAVVKMETQPWKVTFFQPQELFLTPIRAQTQQTLLLATAISLLVAIIGLIIAQWFARPLKQLTRAAEMVSAGNLDVQAPVNSNDEFGTLARAFNLMTAQLRSHVALLEQRVADRTQELAQTNRELADQRDFAEQVVSSMGQGLAVLDEQSRITYANPTFERLLGCTNEELIGKTPFDLFLSEHAPTIESIISHIQAGEETVHELQLHCASDDVKWVLAIVAPRYRGDEVFGGILVVTDLTDIKAAARDLAEARDAALESSRLKSEFLATMSHEIRTPMNGIIGMSELLVSTKLNREQLDLARVVQSEAHSLLTIINDILDFSKVEAGKLAIDKHNFDLRAMLKRVLEPLKPRAAIKGLSLELVIDQQVPHFVRADEGRIKQILLNLIGNSVKFTRRGYILVEVKVAATTEIETFVYFGVKDTGSGIAESALTNLFEPFVQADGSITREHGGTGLGLAISKRLVELMGGELGVETKLGLGSRFWFKLPLEKGVAPDKPIVVVEDVIEETVSAEKHLLLVEDNFINQKVALKQLDRLGYTADVAVNGQEAINILLKQRSHYQAVLMDMQMPVMDGLTATREIRNLATQLAPHIPIIAMTANAIKGDLERCLEAGMDDYISKPVTTKALSEKLEKWCA